MMLIIIFGEIMGCIFLVKVDAEPGLSFYIIHPGDNKDDPEIVKKPPVFYIRLF
jgi:hypothetical protein